jgi:predicted RNase H-like HicB family nuclease
MQLTLDGMISAPRLKVHTVGEDYEEAVRRAEQWNERALTLLGQELRRFALEAGDEFGR